MPSSDIAVIVRSADPLTLAGAISHLRYTPGLELVESSPRPGRDQVAVVLAHRMDEMTAVELRRLTREPGQQVVLVTDRLREHELMTVLGYGVRTILWLSDVTPTRLAGAVRAAANGESQLPQDLLGRLMAQVGRSERAAALALASPATGLAPREIDVLKLLAEGLDTRQVAEKLAYSERTIKNILSGLMTRLRLRNRAHAVAYALREGYI